MNTPLTSHAREFVKLARQMAKLKEEYAKCQAQLVDLPPGRYGNVTVYNVKEYVVRSHYRRAHTRIRITR